MKILVVGSGGREHALVWKLAQSPRADKIWCAPGNGGIGCEKLAKNDSLVECVDLAADDLPGLLAFARAQRPDLTVIGPDNPLALGIVDLFQQNQLRVWGPNRRAAQFEASKAFAQTFMEKYRIPTARSGVFDNSTAAKAFAEELDGKCAVKADGLALGKGVLICGNVSESGRAIDEILVQHSFGAAGNRIVVQEFLEGTEISLHALCDGTSAILFPTSQDHKRALDNDHGLNTGGMGAYSPAPFLSSDDLKQVSEAILNRWLEGCAAEKIDFHGILYPGLMLTKTGPKVLEFNARFGDPETQVYLTRLENDLVELLEASIDGQLHHCQLKWHPGSAICVVMASEGYPGHYEKGRRIDGLPTAGAIADVKVFHAGTRRSDDQFITSGGRVLGVTAWGPDLAGTRRKAYGAVDAICFEGAQFRRDIGAKALNIAG